MRHTSLLTAVMIATLAVFLTGCSRSPVAPITDNTGAPGAGPMVFVDPDGSPPSDGGTPISRTVTLTAIDEGAVVVGRWTLWIRKNSLKMPATITLKVADPEATEIQLEISPPQANDFQSPVVLTANCSDLASINYDTATMEVWSGVWQLWTDVAAHRNQENVVAHFKLLPSGARLAEGDGKGNNKLGA